ncbi:MAG: hypothetical protein KDE20_28930, partial [Caldilineaceae bacterium]|nr:hypothetical protein [Caldilineaceae bacterium]
MPPTPAADPQYDLLIRQARVIDPAQEFDQIADIAVHAGKIAGIGDYQAATANQIIDAAGSIVSPGWIDLHAHVFAGGSKSGLNADQE